MQVLSNNKRMAKNTILMYIRMLVLIIVQLYTVPILLRALGIEDYGIYNVVAGFVVMFTFVNGSLISGCERFLAYEIGRGDKIALVKVFESSLMIFICLAIILLLILESFGVWFLNNELTIPYNRLEAANWILQLSIISMMFTVLATPYNAAVIAHERMSVYAYASILGGLFQLISVCLLVISPIDKLVFYASLIALSSILQSLFYVIYCRLYFRETKGIRLRVHLKTLKDISGYASWNIVGSTGIMLRNHGLNVVMNIFFSPVMNAAHSIAAQISGALNQFVTNVYLATRPQMVKQYAKGNITEMWSLIFKSGKLAFFLLTYILVPVLIELPSIIRIWLHDVPEYTVVFGRLMLISLAVETLVNQIIGAFQAANKIKYIQSTSSLILLLVVPLSYFSLLLSPNPITPYYIYVFISVLYIITLLIIAYLQLNLDVVSYVKEVVIKDLGVLMPSLLLTYCIVSSVQWGDCRIVLTVLLSLIFTTLLMWGVGLEKKERKYILAIIAQKIYGGNYKPKN